MSKTKIQRKWWHWPNEKSEIMAGDLIVGDKFYLVHEDGSYRRIDKKMAKKKKKKKGNGGGSGY